MLESLGLRVFRDFLMVFVVSGFQSVEFSGFEVQGFRQAQRDERVLVLGVGILPTLFRRESSKR